jgi:hypothetical protein
MGKIFELIRPKSLQNAAYEAYEYLIRWIGSDGADYIYMFYDVEIEHKIKNEVINKQDSANIEALAINHNRSIALFADDLSGNDLNIIGQLFDNTFVTRLLKDNTIERYAPDANSFKPRLMHCRYNVEFTLIMTDVTVWK